MDLIIGKWKVEIGMAPIGHRTKGPTLEFRKSLRTRLPCATMTTVKRFENADHAAAYAKFRPVYPRAVAEIITTYMKSNGGSGFEFAVDVACGSGQSTFLLCEYFQKVVGFDVSAAQIAQAKSKCTEVAPNVAVSFEVGDAHNLQFEPSSIDLLTCGMAWHWLDAEKFYVEAKRVLKPKGCLAIYGYGVHIKHNEHIKNAFDAFFDELIKSNCLGKAMLAVNNYEAVKLPFSQTQRIEFDLPQKATINQVLGLFCSTASYRSYCEKYPENDLLQKIQNRYEMESGRCNVEEFTYPGFVILGMKD